jgi:hypothetical protein
MKQFSRARLRVVRVVNANARTFEQERVHNEK